MTCVVLHEERAKLGGVIRATACAPILGRHAALASTTQACACRTSAGALEGRRGCCTNPDGLTEV
jgi:hypothetical protein